MDVEQSKNVYLRIGKELSEKMTKSELTKFSQEVANYLQYAGLDKNMKIKLFQTIIEVVARKKYHYQATANLQKEYCKATKQKWQ